MHSTLLLNASYEPIGPVSVQRAVVLVLTGRAELVEANGTISSPSTTLPRPAVIRLVRFVTRAVMRTRAPAPSKARILERDDHTCQYCGDVADTIDHVVPRAAGGVTSWRNCVAACEPCNATKASRSLQELGWTLARPPGPPDTLQVRLLTPSLPPSLPEPWRPYVEAWAVA